MKNELLNGIKHLKKDKYLGSIVSKMKVPHFAHEPIFFQSPGQAPSINRSKKS